MTIFRICRGWFFSGCWSVWRRGKLKSNFYLMGDYQVSGMDFLPSLCIGPTLNTTSWALFTIVFPSLCQPLWLPLFSLTTLEMLLPQALCTCFFCLKCPTSATHMADPSLLSVFTQVPPLSEDFCRHSTSLTIPSSFPCMFSFLLSALYYIMYYTLGF